MRAIAYYSTPRRIAEFMVSLLPKDRSISILDAGCGKGEFLSVLQHSGYKNVTGIEICKEFAEYCRRRFPEYRIIHGDFLLHTGQYDAVISNPPYIKLKELPDELRVSALKYTGKIQSNLYYAFIAHAIEVLKPSGVMVFIIPSSFRGNTYAIEIRRLLNKTGTVTHAVMFRNENVFHDVTPNVMIFKWIKKKISLPTYLARVRDIDMPIRYKPVSQEDFLNVGGGRGATVGDYALGIFVGFASGCDTCFLVRDELLYRLTDEEMKYVVDVVTASDCGRYRLKGTTKYLLLNEIEDEDELRRLSNIYKWLMRNEKRLKNRYLPSRAKWWHWQATRNKNKYDVYADNPKIMFPSMVRGRPRFCITDRHLYPSSSVMSIIPKPGYEFFLLGYLNSSTFERLYRRLGFVMGGRLIFTHKNLSKIPVPDVSRNDLSRISYLAKRLTIKYDESLDREIDEILSTYVDDGMTLELFINGG